MGTRLLQPEGAQIPGQRAPEAAKRESRAPRVTTYAPRKSMANLATRLAAGKMHARVPGRPLTLALWLAARGL